MHERVVDLPAGAAVTVFVLWTAYRLFDMPTRQAGAERVQPAEAPATA